MSQDLKWHAVTLKLTSLCLYCWLFVKKTKTYFFIYFIHNGQIDLPGYQSKREHVMALHDELKHGFMATKILEFLFLD